MASLAHPSQLSPLGAPDWVRTRGDRMVEYTPEEWRALAVQRDALLAKERPRVALQMLEAGKQVPSFGYHINMYRHSLQAATFALRDGRDEETVAVALLHDLAFSHAKECHGQIAAMILGPFISEANRWMLEHHAVFADNIVQGVPGVDPNARERWRGHPHFAWTAEFIDRYDNETVSAAKEILPVEAFEPMVHRLFERTPNYAHLGRAK
jgi:predicted HD phosphohydrolase